MTERCPGVFMDDGAQAALALLPPPRGAMFLDRDGVINTDRGYVHEPEQTEFAQGIFALCQAARDAGLVTIVVTNQAGIARGLYSERQFIDYTRWMHGEFARREVPLLATYYCPHHPTAGIGAYRLDCPCRKPAPGMLLGALNDFAIDPLRSTLIGDKVGDVQAGQAAGIARCVLLDECDQQPSRPADSLRASSLAEVRDLLFTQPIQRP